MNINEILKGTENSTVKFKEEINESMFKTISAFANKEYREITKISRQMATIELTNIVDRGVFIKIGKAGKGVAYQLHIN